MPKKSIGVKREGQMDRRIGRQTHRRTERQGHVEPYGQGLVGLRGMTCTGGGGVCVRGEVVALILFN